MSLHSIQFPTDLLFHIFSLVLSCSQCFFYTFVYIKNKIHKWRQQQHTTKQLLYNRLRFIHNNTQIVCCISSKYGFIYWKDEQIFLYTDCCANCFEGYFFLFFFTLEFRFTWTWSIYLISVFECHMHCYIYKRIDFIDISLEQHNMQFIRFFSYFVFGFLLRNWK